MDISQGNKRMIPELLAPAGGVKQLVAAVNNGADAVYMGGILFNARMKASNFDDDTLRRCIDYAHERNVAVHIALNILIRDDELEKAFEYANKLAGMGADAIIVQDMGLARLVRKYLPEMTMHLSTQATVYNKWAINLAKDFGFSRIVPARELNRRELAEFTEACHRAGCEVETFVHGALCFCYSGQCQMSRVLGKNGENPRSGNRGLCAQPCRLLYNNQEGKSEYLLSPRDICLLRELPYLIDMGIDSLKIEGRLKSPEYVAVVTSIYRKYLDLCAEGKGQIDDNGRLIVNSYDMYALTQIFNRGKLSPGYFYGDPGDELMSGSSPKNHGVLIGRVIAPAGYTYPATAGNSSKIPKNAAGRKHSGNTCDDKKTDCRKEQRVKKTDKTAFAYRSVNSVKSMKKASRASKSKGHNSDAISKAVEGAAKRKTDLIVARLSGELNIGDGVEIRTDRPGSAAAGNVVTYLQELSGGKTLIGDFRAADFKSREFKKALESGCGIYKVTDIKLLEKARESFAGESPAEWDRHLKRKIRVEIRFTARIGQNPVLEFEEINLSCATDDTDKRLAADQGKRCINDAAGDEINGAVTAIVIIKDDKKAERAVNKPTSPKRAAEQLAKLRGTPFTADAARDIEVDIENGCMIPISQINDMRRRAVAGMLARKRALGKAGGKGVMAGLCDSIAGICDSEELCDHDDAQYDQEALNDRCFAPSDEQSGCDPLTNERLESVSFTKGHYDCISLTSEQIRHIAAAERLGEDTAFDHIAPKPAGTRVPVELINCESDQPDEMIKIRNEDSYVCQNRSDMRPGKSRSLRTKSDENGNQDLSMNPDNHGNPDLIMNSDKQGNADQDNNSKTNNITNNKISGVYPYILNISKGKLDKYIEDNFDKIAESAEKTGIAIGNMGWIKQFVSAGVKVYGEYGLNIYNAQAARAYEEAGVTVTELSLETRGQNRSAGSNRRRNAKNDKSQESGGRERISNNTMSQEAGGSHFWSMNSNDIDEAGSTHARSMDSSGITEGGGISDTSDSSNIPLMITEHRLQPGTFTDRKGAEYQVIRSPLGDKSIIYRKL